MTSLSLLATQSLRNFVHHTVPSRTARSTGSRSSAVPAISSRACRSLQSARFHSSGKQLDLPGKASSWSKLSSSEKANRFQNSNSRRVVPRVQSMAGQKESDGQKGARGSAGGKKKILAVLYKAGEYAKNPDFLACAENGLGLKDWLKEQGHEYIVTDDKDGDNSELDKQLPTINILITTPFHPAYMTKERIQKAKNLELIITAGVGSDHIDLHAAAEAGLTVAEITGSNVTSVAEDEIMRILILMRNFIPGYKQIINGEWNVAAVAHKARDLERKVVGTLGSGRIGQEMAKRLQAWDVTQLYYARHQNEKIEQYGATWEKDLDTFLGKCDVISINVPLTDKTRGMIGKEQIAKMKKGAYLVNNARGPIVDRDAVVEASKSGQLGGYGGDVWYPQPPGKDHPWRYMPNHAMTPHLSGTTLDAQVRYAEGTKNLLECWFTGKPFPEDDYIVREGKLASQYE